jgi:hypothetical protein
VTSQTVASYLADFFASVQTLSPKTLERYQELVQRQITPHIGDVRLQRLTPELIHGTEPFPK